MPKRKLQRFNVICLRCMWEWRTWPCRHDDKPARCPRCKSVYWHRPRTRSAA